MRTGTRTFIAGIAILACSMAHANDACLLTPSELETLTGRAFSDGQPGKKLGDGSPLCHYPQKDQPQRKLTIAVSSANAQRQFESRARLLQAGGQSIDLKGVGDRAYYNGTAAGVLSGDTLITITNLRRSSDPKIAPEKVSALLQLALKKTQERSR